MPKIAGRRKRRYDGEKASVPVDAEMKEDSAPISQPKLGIGAVATAGGAR